LLDEAVWIDGHVVLPPGVFVQSLRKRDFSIGLRVKKYRVKWFSPAGAGLMGSLI
jgi:hypothetical protein